MAAPASELGWVVHFAPVVRFTPLSPTGCPRGVADGGRGRGGHDPRSFENRGGRPPQKLG